MKTDQDIKIRINDENLLCPMPCYKDAVAEYRGIIISVELHQYDH